MSDFRSRRNGYRIDNSWLVVLVTFPCLICASRVSGQDEFRTWTDSTGKFQRQAQLVELVDPHVKLQMPEGAELTVTVSQLSLEDQKYVRSRATIKIDEEPVRSWSDITGKFRRDAKLTALVEAAVKLRMRDGKEITLAISRLCRDDQEFVGSRQVTKLTNPRTQPTKDSVPAGTDASKKTKVRDGALPGGKGPLWENISKTGSRLKGGDVASDYRELDLAKRPKSRKLAAGTKALHFQMVFAKKPFGFVHIDVENKDGPVEVKWAELSSHVEDLTTGEFILGMHCETKAGELASGPYQAKVNVNGAVVAQINWDIGNAN